MKKILRFVNLTLLERIIRRKKSVIDELRFKGETGEVFGVAIVSI